MTYCVGILLRQGLIMIADTRTNAGIDNISTYRKLHVLADTEDRFCVVASAGNLSVTQLVLGMLAEGLPSIGVDDPPRRIESMPTMFRAAQLIGEAVMEAGRQLKPALHAAGVSSGISLLFGGRIGNNPPQLFLIYDAGNFIECSSEVPFLQIGETKYGKPILDRGLSNDMPLHEAVKVGFLSFDSAMRSNLGVARPLDMMVLPADPREKIITRRIDSDDEYFNELSMLWASHLRDATRSIPDPPWMPAEEAAE